MGRVIANCISGTPCPHSTHETEHEKQPMRSADIPPTRSSLALSELPAIRALVRARWYPYLFQGALLVALIAMAIIGLRSVHPDGVDEKLVAKGSLETLVVWGLWWPLMIWGAVLLGRAWCTVCPLELVSNAGERLARRLGIKGGTMGRWLRAGWMALLLYLAMQLLVAGLHMHRSAWITGAMIIGLVALAFATSFVLRDRAFCRGFCPARLLLGAYGRFGALSMRAMSPEACDDCPTRDCTDASLRTGLDGRSCPSLLDPSRLASNAECLACGQCVKVCPSGNMAMLLRAPFHPADDRPGLAPWTTTAFVAVAVSFVLAELAAEWPAARSVVLVVPERVAGLAGGGAIGGWIEGAWIALVAPALVMIVFGLIASAGKLRRLTTSLRRIAIPLAVVVASGHMAKAFVKATSWAGFLPLDIADPLNHTTSASVAGELVARPASLVPIGTASILGVVLVALGLAFAVRELRRTDALSVARALPLVLLAIAYGTIIVGWGS
jgi:polyferredoxin